MKNEILDDIFNDNFRNQLDPNEKVIWEGRPQLESTKRSLTKWLGFFILIIHFINHGFNLLMLIFGLAYIAVLIFQFLQAKRIRYLITDQRILFQLWQKRKTTFRSLPFEEIRHISVRKEKNETTGAILIRTKRKELSFHTKNLETGDDRYQPSLELIENVEEVAQYIESEIQKRLE